MKDKRELFWKLLEPEYKRAMMFCHKLAGEKQAGDDLYQDSLIRAFKYFEKLRDTGSFRPWLYRIIMNTHKSEVGKFWWKKRLPIESVAESELPMENSLNIYEARRWLTRAFTALSADDQSLVTLYELEGWSIGELAGMMKKSEGSIKTRLSRARQKMKKQLAKYKTAPEATTGMNPITNGEPQ